MPQNLYLEAAFDDENDGKAFVTVETFIALFALQYVDAPTTINVYLVETSRDRAAAGYYIHTDRLKHKRLSEEKFRETSIASNCNFPVMLTDKDVVVAGLCGVCRNIVKYSADADYADLLGFKGSCLLAPSEASVWTKFCEVDIVNCTKSMIDHLTRLSDVDDAFPLPVEFARFENHMAQPIRMHNIYDFARKLAEEKSAQETAISDALNGLSLQKKRRKPKPQIACTVAIKDLNLEHKYAEGQRISIADIILFPCFWTVWTDLQKCAESPIESHLPLTFKWMTTIRNENEEKIANCLALLVPPHSSSRAKCTIASFQIEIVENYSLYKSDPKRYKPRNRIFTKQPDIDVSLKKVQRLGLDISSVHHSSTIIDDFDWASIPFEALPEGGALPAKRLQRKKDQLESLAREMISMAHAGDRIVDFCSGAGHLGILLAHKLPQCVVYLLENKEESLMRAKERVHQLRLTNVRFFQCNLDYFIGPFEIGTSLHACGVATDIVLMHCLNRKARFVCCPCCYGGCLQMPHISYPRSEFFRQHEITTQDFMHIAHCADQAHDLAKTSNVAKSVQGQFCMDVVDTDRKLYAEECGYQVTLSRLQPEDCTPKNRLLVGFV